MQLYNEVYKKEQFMTDDKTNYNPEVNHTYTLKKKNKMEKSAHVSFQVLKEKERERTKILLFEHCCFEEKSLKY